MSTPRVQISIIIYKGTPLDYTQYRHTALWLRFSDQSPALLVHIIGPQGLFQFAWRAEANPSTSQRFANEIQVGLLNSPATPNTMIRELQMVPILNRDREFNCQTWVEQALKRFKDGGFLSEETYDNAVKAMVDAIAEAGDEEQ